MITVHCKKAWKGNIDIRSHIVKKAIDNNQPITVTCDAFTGNAIYTPDELRNPLYTQGPYQSKFDGEYLLHIYKWKQ
jgi:hypothetical protein